MKAIWKDHIIAQSDNTITLEGNHYFPLKSVNPQYLQNSNTTTHCPWKGTANYYHIHAGAELLEDAAWYYADPKPKAAQIKNHIAFWKGVKVEPS